MTQFAVSTGHDLTADTAAQVLAEGGTAVDAVIAGAAMAMVAEPVLAGLLGGGFLMVRAPNGRTNLLDFFVQTPSRAVSPDDLDFSVIEAEFGTTSQEFHIGTGTIAVPGVASGLAEAHARYGRIPFSELIAPASAAARKGVEITPFQAQLAQIVGAILKATPSAEALWTVDGVLQQSGQTAHNPDFADVLEVFGVEGPRFVMEGEVATALLELCREGGQVTASDLRGYTAKWRMPLEMRRGKAKVRLNPPPSLGGTLMGFGLEICPPDPDPIDIVRTLEATLTARIEAAIDDRPVAGTQTLLNSNLLDRYRNEVANRARSTRGTTHISAIDRDGMGAALTLSNGEGCGHVLRGIGIMPNNMLGEDDLMPAGMHSWKPGQRLSSMMCPLVTEWPDGQFAMLGSGGSNRIRSALLQVLVGLIDRGHAPEDAVAAARIHVDGSRDGPQTDFEDLGDDEFRERVLTAAPEARPWSDPSMFFGGVHMVQSDGRGNLQAAGDPRRAGAHRIG
ncbi:MAG: gamma-glutamyltransferase [Paracoccaceae bacterium]